MAGTVICGCGWYWDGTEEELIEAYMRHVEIDHRVRLSREDAAAHVKQQADK